MVSFLNAGHKWSTHIDKHFWVADCSLLACTATGKGGRGGRVGDKCVCVWACLREGGGTEGYDFHTWIGAGKREGEKPPGLASEGMQTAIDTMNNKVHSITHQCRHFLILLVAIPKVSMDKNTQKALRLYLSLSLKRNRGCASFSFGVTCTTEPLQ